MRALLIASLAAALAAPASASAQPDPAPAEPDAASTEPAAQPERRAARWGVSVKLRTGGARAPFYTAALSEVTSEFSRAQAVLFGGFVRLNGPLELGIRVPLAQSAVLLPGASYVEDVSLGNIELYFEDQRFSRQLPRARLNLALRFGAGLPLAGHGPSTALIKNRVVALSNALDGWQNPELWEPGVVPLTLSGRLFIEPAPWGVSLRVKLPLLIRVNDADLPDEARTQALGFLPQIALRGTVQPLKWLGIHVGTHVVFLAPAAVSAVEGSDRSGAVHWGFAPEVEVTIARHLMLSVEFNAAIAGPLRGTLGIGLGLRVEG